MKIVSCEEIFSAQKGASFQDFSPKPTAFLNVDNDDHF